MKNKFAAVCIFTAISLQVICAFNSCSPRRLYDEQSYEREGEEVEENENEEEEQNGADKQLSSWFQQKGYPDATGLHDKYANGWEEFLQVKANTARLIGGNGHSRTEGMGSWTHIGPKAFGGRILSLAINPVAHADGNRTIFAGSAGGGIWKSYVSGVGASAWQPVVVGKHVLGVASIVYHPTDTSLLLAGTGEVYRVENYSSSPYSSDQVSNLGRNAWKARGTYGVGILRSTDGGLTWTQPVIKIHADLFGIQKIKWHPTIAGTVFACATDGLYKSTDYGATWTNIWNGTFVSDIIINPSDVTQIVIAAGNVTNSSKGVWRSTNSGSNFSQVTGTGFPAETAYKGSTNFTLLNGNIIASVGVGDANNDGSYTEREVYRSNDFGSTWVSVSNSTHAKWQSWFAHGVTAFPGSTNKIFMYGVKKHVLVMSGATGATGTLTNIATGSASSSVLVDGSQEGSTTYVHDDVHEVDFVPGSTSVAYWATDGGVFRTTNADVDLSTGTMTFESCNGGLYAQQFFPTIAQSQSSGNLIFGGLQDNGVIKYDGTGWSKVIGGDGTTCTFKPDNESIILASSDTRGVYRSTNTGNSFTAVMSYLGNIPNGKDDRTSFCSPVVVAPSDYNRWYVGSDNIHVSTDAGVNFSNDVAGVPGTNYVEALHKPAIAMAVSYQDADKLYVSVSPFSQNLTTDALYYTPPANVRRSTNGGGAFSTRSTGLPDRIVTDFAVSPTQGDSVFVTLGGFNTTHVYVTGDGGLNWSPCGSGLPNFPFNTILIDPANPQVLYAGSDFGVYVSNDRGVNWYDFNNNFWDATYVMDLTFAPGNKIRAATHGKGIFESPKWNGFVTLPVRFKNFTGFNNGNVNELTWIVDQESNMDKYELERSLDGFNYQVVKNITSRNSVNQSTYQVSDPLGNRPAPVYFYRVKSVNRDGSYSYSNIVKIRISNKASFDVIGNPFRNDLAIRYNAPVTGKIVMGLYNMNGALMRREETVLSMGTGVYTMRNLSSLPAGIYILGIEMLGEKTSIKVLRQQ